MKVLRKLLLCLVLCCGATFAQINENPLLVVLSDTGQIRDGLPVLKPHPEGPAVAEALLKGFPLKLLRLYRYVQIYLNAGPFSDLSGLESVQGMSRLLMERFRFMAQEMERLKIGDEDSALSSLPRVVVSYLWRALSVLVVASISGGMFYRRVRRSGLFRSVINSLAVSFLVVAFSWGVVGAEGFLGYLLPVLIFGLPSLLFHLARRRWKLALPELLAWAVAALPAKVLSYPWF